jgi:inhibitor of KinA sporulation pathway (predicted exonuclease)
MNQPSNKIIQIGACIGDLNTGIVEAKFNRYITIDESVAPFIEQLTGITDNRLATEGVSLQSAYSSLKTIVNSFSGSLECNPITWGGGDSGLLHQQLGEVEWVFGRRWLDIKTLFQWRQMRKGEKPQAGLAKAMTKCGLRFQGRKHDALDDAINTFALAHYLFKEGL